MRLSHHGARSTTPRTCGIYMQEMANQKLEPNVKTPADPVNVYLNGGSSQTLATSAIQGLDIK